MTNPKPKPAKARFLCPKARVGDGHGYTDIAELGMRGEPGCLDEEDWKRYIAPRAHQGEAERLAAEQRSREREVRLLSQEERILKAQREARLRCRDVTREVRLLRSMQAREKAPETLEKRLQVLERIVYLGRAA